MTFVGNPEFGVKLHNPFALADWATNCGGQGFKVEQPADLEPAFRAAFVKTDGPTLVECVVDPDEAPLPPKISTEHAINFMKAVARGQEHPIRIATTMFRDKVDELLVQDIGGIPGPESIRRGGEPDERDERDERDEQEVYARRRRDSEVFINQGGEDGRNRRSA